jgi:hypothetical protein
MKRQITKSEQQRINELLDARRKKQVKIITQVDGKERLAQYDLDNKIARNGMTYLEIEQFNNTYNNFR